MKYGYFDDENKEYVIKRPDIPVSWTNYLGVKDLCTVLSHNAGGYTFYKSSEHNRLTRFRPNGVPLDRPGHYVYIRDNNDADYWSISWQPVGKDLSQAHYECRHGLSYSRFKCRYKNIEAEKCIFIPLDDNVELWDVRLKNTAEEQRDLSIFSYLEFSFQHVEIDNQNLQMSLYASGSSFDDNIIEFDFFYEPWTYHFFTADFDADSYDCVRDTFLGNYHTESNPEAVINGACFNSSELGGNHCASLQKNVVLQPGEEKRFIFILGVGSRDKKGRSLRKKYSDFKTVDKAFNLLKKYWRTKCDRFKVDTPHAGMNTMLNSWTLFQAETCVVWSRFASFIEVGGRTGLGYRDTSQDVMGVVHSNPEKCKQRLEELFQGHTSMGYGLHLFDPDVFKPREEKLPGVKLPTVVPTPSREDIIHGLEDVCADDAIWLVASTCEWIMETGDFGFFEQQIPYADKGSGTVYEHLKKILDFASDHTGQTGICQGLRADWNDCLNLGGGESAMVSFMHYWALRYFVEAADFLGKKNDAQLYSDQSEKVKKACESVLWDGEWYLRGFTKKGAKIGSRENNEGKLFLNAQTWAVYSGVADKDRAITCMDNVDQYLSSGFGLHLLWPAYSSPDDDIGYVTRVYKGIKENASIFSHPNPWAVIAECRLGRGSRAMKFYDAILPYNQNDMIEKREAEPYSYCQFIYGKDHKAHGRARHPWLTGTAGWFYTAATKHILGIQPKYEGLLIDPCIPAEWSGFSVERTWRGADYQINVQNPDNVEKGIKAIILNNTPFSGLIPSQPKGSKNTVQVIMG